MLFAVGRPSATRLPEAFSWPRFTNNPMISARFCCDRRFFFGNPLFFRVHQGGLANVAP